MRQPFLRSLSVIALVLLASIHVMAQENSEYIVVNTTVLELEDTVGPGNAVYLSPDGSQLLHYKYPAFCFYALPSAEQTRCVELPDDVGPPANSVVWSPDSRYVAFMSGDVVRMFRDSDIAIIDSQEGTLTNLTEDGVSEIRFTDEDDDEPAPMVDMSPQWLDDTTLVFVRIDMSGDEEEHPTALYSVSVTGGEAELLQEIPQSQKTFDVYMLNWLTGTDTYAVNLYNPDDDLYGVLFAEDGGFPVSIIAGTDFGSRAYSLGSIDISPDARYVMSYDMRGLSMMTDETQTPAGSPVQITGTDDFITRPIDSRYGVWDAGFSPDGTAIAYTVRHRDIQAEDGLYITSTIGEDGTLVLPGRPVGPSLLGMQPITWASNDTLLIVDLDGYSLILVELGRE
ncbi:MAG: hypothetical protein KC708_08740 [Anaerolineae bacterium]|nr:hypothetical protein [Anaerolineae bacterium]